MVVGVVVNAPEGSGALRRRSLYADVNTLQGCRVQDARPLPGLAPSEDLSNTSLKVECTIVIWCVRHEVKRDTPPYAPRDILGNPQVHPTP